LDPFKPLMSSRTHSRGAILQVVDYPLITLFFLFPLPTEFCNTTLVGRLGNRVGGGVAAMSTGHVYARRG
jgi:hypothetical protein